jgi:PKD repeat protein
MDSLGAGLCNPVNYAVTVTSMVPTPTTYNFFSYPTGAFTPFTLPNPAMHAVTANPTVACSTLCTFNAGFSVSSNALTASFTPQPFGLSGYFWTFGDGGTSNSMAPSHTYAAAGTYTVCMIGTSGCMSDTICQQVTVVCTPANAAFTTTAAQQTITFTNTSSGSAPLTYAWAFGDGQTSTQTSPVHVYSAPGYYNACLIVNGPCGADTTCTLINAGCVATVAAFSSTTNLLAAQFSNTSISAGATTAFWDFGDGQTSTQVNPSHTYPAAGTYTVCLIANSPCGADTLCQSVTITCPMPVPGFSATTNQLLANFSNSSTGVVSSIWDFGDGQTSTQANPSHTYAAAGTYTVCLIVNSTCGADTLCQPVTIICPLPVPVFTATSNQLTANFSNSSTGAASSIWDFGDGQTSTQANPSHTYAAAGTYTVCLIVNSTCGADTLCQSVTIICPLPVPGFSATTNQLMANFSNSSTGAASSIWDFGDGQTSSQANPSHTYAAAGTYTVCLIVNSTCGADTLCQSVTVTCPILTAAMSSAGIFPLVQFTDMTIGSPSVWQWDFGDGGTSVLQNPQHNYANPGTYTVCLTVQDSCSVATTCQSVDVLVGVTKAVTLTVEVYPNPAFATVWVRWPQDLDVVTLQVMTMDGRQVFQTTTAEGEFAINLNGWTAGVYAVAVQAGDQRVVRRLVVQR